MKKLILLLFLFAITSSTNLWAGSAKEVVQALMKLDTKVETGISRQDYPSALADAKFEVKLFNQSEEANKCPLLTESINKALSHYEKANELMMRCTGRCIRISATDDFAQELLRLYPEANNPPVFHIDYGNMPFLGLSPMVSLIWSKASIEIENAMKLLTKCSQENNDASKEQNKKRENNQSMKKRGGN